jgi:hypothetical protein
MALLSGTRSTLRARIPLLFMALSAAGCVLFSSKEDVAPLGLAFPHKVHVAEGLECADCHPGAASGEEPGMPRRQQCMLCHKEIDEKKPPEKQIAQLFDGDTFKAQHASAVSAEVVFPHAKHASAEKNCSACHTGIEESERIVRDHPFTMARCQQCHAQYKVADDCATCHREIRRDVAPPSHEHNWKMQHGRVVRAETGDLVNNCALCHTESTCVSCHLDEPPPNHNNFWRLRGHAVLASMDRQNCAACHRPDSCERCHEAMLPQNHVGMWGSPKDTHCNVCHFPLSTNGCLTCHKGTPSHDTAAPLPSWHNPGMNCRQCHGVTQPLPHVDNGSNCIMCHH